MRRPYHALVLIVMLLGLLATSAQAARVALVIGNDSYANVARLKNARADAKAMAKALEGSGFRVTLVMDADRESMNEALRRFRSSIVGGDETVFSYAGHAVELDGVNYLLPTDIRDDNDERVANDALPLQRVLSGLAQQKPRFSLVIIDACRDNPFEGKTRNVATRGLVPAAAAVKGQMIIYSAGAGQRALDRLRADDPSPNGVFTRVFVREIEKGGQPVHEVVRLVKDEVTRLAESVGHEQMPAIYDQSVGTFYFRRGADPAPKPTARCVADEALWQAATQLNTVEGFDAYLLECEAGRFASMARAAKKKLASAGKAEADGLTVPGPKPSDTSKWDPFAPTQAPALSNGARPPLDYSISDARTRRESAAKAERPRLAGDEYPPGKVFKDCEACPEVVVIPGGTFEMGSPPGEAGRETYEGPMRTVRVEKFGLGRTEITRGQFRQFADATGRDVSGCELWNGQRWKTERASNWESPGYGQTDDHPVVCVSWEVAREYVMWLSRTTGKEYRLPTEAEWEYAARAGTRTIRHWGDGVVQACAYANVADTTGKLRYGWTDVFPCDDGHPETSPVGSFESNAFGLKDMLGNVIEWTQDCYKSSYVGAPTNGSAVTDSKCVLYSARGGSWIFYPSHIRSATRYGFMFSDQHFNLGFRVSRTLP